MSMGIFANCIFCLNIKHLPRQQKKKLQTDIQENGGNVSFILNPQCTHVISDSADDLSKYHLNSIQKNQIHLANPDFIWESIKERRLLDVKNYIPDKSPDSTVPLCQEANSSEVKKDDGCLDHSAETGDMELTRFYTENVEIPHFPQDFEVAKYNTLEKVGTEGGQDIAVLELQCPQDPGHSAFRISACFLPAGDTETQRQFFVRPTSADASECYENYIEELKKQGFWLREHFTPEATQLASGKLQAWLLEEDIRSSALSQEVSDLVEMIWAEALGHLEHTLLTPANRISLNDVSKAEGILLHVKAALKSGETEEQLQNMMSEFYRLIPHRGSTTEKVNLRLLANKEDLCQLIRDMANVNETNLSKPNPPSLAKYQALRCKIEHVEQNTEEFFRIREEVLQNNRSQSPADILQIFRVGRASETTAFLSQLGNVTPLLHGSPVQSFVGILSRGLLLPKVVEDRGVTRTDVGNLGSGIYFSDSLSTSTKYSHPGDTDGTRLLVACDVALGKCLDLHKKDYSLTEAPPGYDSVHGVPGTAAVTTDFEDDEFVVYKTNQVKMKYIIKFCLPGDEIKDFHPCNNTELEEHTPEISNFPAVEDYWLPDGGPSSSLGAGLQDASGNLIPLEDVCIKGKIIDFVAQVVVFQTYTNQSHVPIEAKYVFPLDDKAAVCGFEAFINGKHIVGEIKEKEAAHQEYREAIRQGHGAYLIDQDAPDVFTVSVGNLPPKAEVLIKITYITELSIQGTVAVFFMPATVAPWQQDKALNENLQDTVKKIYVKEIGSKQSFSLSMSIEMPYVIEFISSDTHKLKKKSTDCKAVISTMEGSTLDSSGFSLHIGLTDAHLPRMWVEKHPEKESEACMLVFHPDLGSALPDIAEKSEVVICLDCSSSMEGVTFLHAKQIALYALALVGKEQKVNVVKFGSGYQELFSYPKCLTSGSVAAEFITSASPTMGSTDFWKVLRYLSLLPPSQGLRNVLLISDGHLQSDSLTLQLVKQHVQHTRLFSCGVSSTANRHLLRTLSQHGVGAFEYFNSKSKHSWKKQIEDQMARSRSPSCHSISVTWQRLILEAPEPLQAPAQVQALFHGDRLLVYGFIPRCTQATLRALTQKEEFSTMVSTTELQKTTGTMIHKLTARALIRDYEDGILHDDETNHEMKKQVLKSLIIELSKENCLITQFTSFVAVEKRDGNGSPFPNNPNILELVAKDVDILPYMSWQEEQPRGFIELCANVEQPLSAFSDWHGEFHPKRLSKRKQKQSTVKVFGDSEGFSLASKAPEEPLKFGGKYAHAETPLDLSQMEPYVGASSPLTTGISPQMAVFGSCVAPESVGSPAALRSISFSGPCPPHAPPRSSLFSFRGVELSDPAISVTAPKAKAFLKQDLAFRGPPPNPPIASFSGPLFGCSSFGFKQSSLPTPDKGLKACGKLGMFLEVDSSLQPISSFSSPGPPPPFSAADSSLHPPSASSTFNYPESAAPLSTSYRQPAHVRGRAHYAFAAASSNLPAGNAVSLTGLLSAASSSLGTENDETQGFPRITPCIKVAKSHVAERELIANSQAWGNQGFGVCQQSQRSYMPWTWLFSLQTEEGFWKLTPELGLILNLNTDILNSFLEQKGIRSLGVKGRERLLQLIATFLVLQFLRTQLEQEGIVFKSLLKLDDATISRDIPCASEKIKKASEWVRRTEGQYPSICQRLELGKDWDSATKQLLRLQPVNTTSPLHRVLNYSQG